MRRKFTSSIKRRDNSKPYLYVFTKATDRTRSLLEKAIVSLPPGSEYIVADCRKHSSLAKTWNECIRAAVVQGDYRAVILCNDDIEFINDAGKILWDNYRVGSQFGVVITTMYDVDGYEPAGTGLKAATTEMPPGYMCFLVTRELVEKVGWFDEEYKGAYFEDTDMSHRVIKAGLVVATTGPIKHYGAGTVKMDKKIAARREEMYEANLARYTEKWGGPPGYETN